MHNEEKIVIQRPLVVCDGVMTLCTICNKAYIPEESISLSELVSYLKEGLVSRNSPEHQQGIRSTSRKESQTARLTPYKAFSKTQTRSDSETDNEEQYTNSSSPYKRKSSSSSSLNSSIPNSIVLPLRTETLENLGEEELDDVFVDEGITRQQERLSEQIKWMKAQDRDCVALETFSSVKEIVRMVQVFLRSKTPSALEFKVNHNSTITVSYQVLHDFKNDFMMLKVKDKYCMFMSPF